MDLNAESLRILGCLVEKERTVPDSYPMTLNSLVTACNQSTNRWPVVRYEHGEVQRTLDDLKGTGWVRFVHPSHGERTTKFRHVVDEKLALGSDALAVLAVLFLRGPQTVGELRGRTERLHAFASVDEVESVLRGLAGGDEPLVRLLDRRPGERDARWAHLVGGAPGPVEASAPDGGAAPDATRSDLEARVAALEAQVSRLYDLLGESSSEQPPE